MGTVYKIISQTILKVLELCPLFVWAHNSIYYILNGDRCYLSVFWIICLYHQFEDSE